MKPASHVIAAALAAVLVSGCAQREAVELLISADHSHSQLAVTVMAEGRLIRQWQASPPAVLISSPGSSIAAAELSPDGTLLMWCRRFLTRRRIAVRPGTSTVVGPVIVHNSVTPRLPAHLTLDAVVTLIPGPGLSPRGFAHDIATGPAGEVWLHTEVRWLDIPAGTCLNRGRAPLSAGRGWPDRKVRAILDSLVLLEIRPDGVMMIEVAACPIELSPGQSWTGFLIRDRSGSLRCSLEPQDGLVARVDLRGGGRS